MRKQSTTFYLVSFPKKKDNEDGEPVDIQETIAEYARELGGFDKVRKLTLLQARLLSKKTNDEQLFLAKIHGCEIKEENQPHEATSSDIAALMAFCGKK